MSLIRKAVAGGVGILSSVLVFGPTALAASTFTDHLWEFSSSPATFNMINFQKSSYIYDNDDLHLVSRNFIFLDTPLSMASGALATQGAVYFYNAGAYTGSYIVNNGSALHMTSTSSIFLNAPGGVTLPDGSVSSAEILDGTIADADTNGALTGAALAADTLTAGDLAADSVAASEIATGAVTTTEILDGTVASADIADGTVTSADIADGTIVSGDVAADTLTAANLAAGSV